MRSTNRFLSGVALFVAVTMLYLWGYSDGREGRSPGLMGVLRAAPTEATNDWSPTKPYPSHEVYYPGTEELGPDEMRVITCGSGMPMPRLKQAAACILVELGNGDKFIFDMGTGSMERLYALGIPLDFIDKVFLTHLHADHM
ncbi:MAG: MBL fold metallo-hydrolase, partial [Thermoanaerobaculia bacterium]